MTKKRQTVKQCDTEQRDMWQMKQEKWTYILGVVAMSAITIIGVVAIIVKGR